MPAAALGVPAFAPGAQPSPSGCRPRPFRGWPPPSECRPPPSRCRPLPPGCRPLPSGCRPSPRVTGLRPRNASRRPRDADGRPRAAGRRFWAGKEGSPEGKRLRLPAHCPLGPSGVVLRMRAGRRASDFSSEPLAIVHRDPIDPRDPGITVTDDGCRASAGRRLELPRFRGHSIPGIGIRRIPLDFRHDPGPIQVVRPCPGCRHRH